MILMGSAAGTAKETVDELRDKGMKVGVLKLRLFRPFPADEIVEAIKGAKAVAILDRCESYNGNGGPLGTEIMAGLYLNKVYIPVTNYVYGLGGRDFTTADAARVFNELAAALAIDEEIEQYRYIGLREED